MTPFTRALAERILVLDGGFGTMLRQYDLGDAVTSAPGHDGGCNDMLSISRPDVVGDIHRRYLEAGADIIETNSFNANALSLSDYGLQDRAYEIALAAAKVARETVDAYGRAAYVAGSIGPTNRTLSMSADVNSPGARDVTFDQMYEAYLPQVRGLVDGGVDLLMVETIFDTLNAKAALAAIRDVSQDIPVIVSATVADSAGRMLTGQTIEAFYTSVMHAHPVAVGLNCGFGTEAMLPHLQRLARTAEVAVSVHANAGLPNIDGGYDETPEQFAAHVQEYIDRRLVNIVGGCCGTTPEHIRLLRSAVDAAGRDKMREYAGECATVCRVCGLETLEIRPESNFVNVGERANVAGSAKFARLIREGNYDEGLSIVKAQVEAGAQIVDVCMDAPMIDAPEAMTRFLNLMASEPSVARVPVMIDSSDFAVVEAGLKCTQGKSVVNSISLKEGEVAFVDKARRIMRYGAAAVVMLFDERGQADTYERKIEVARRSYDILIGIGFPAADIIFDPNILSVATGMPEHDVYARDFIEATRWIKQNLPHAKVSGGVSNLSFAFRGNNAVRKAMHSVFLYHAIAAGMDMAIVNPQMVQIYDDIEPRLLERVEDLILYRRSDAADRLLEYAQSIAATPADASAPETAEKQWRSLDTTERIRHALLNGDTEYIAADTLEAYNTLGDAVAVINDILMPAMARVGQLFGEGRLFLPQVVKSARVMKLAVAAIQPYISASGSSDAAGPARTVVIATVKGDVHDIGKNIVGVVLACNGWRVLDLGVMVDASRILDEAVASGASAICLSGLITPSLEEMAIVVKEAERRGLDIPIVVGGATTSDLHTAVKLAPHYRGVVVRAADAADNAAIVGRFTLDDRDEYIANVKSRQQMLRSEHAASAHKADGDRPQFEPGAPVDSDILKPEVIERTVAQVRDKINWSFFFSSWGLPGRYPDIFDHPTRGEEARRIYADAQAMLDDMEASRSIILKGVVLRCKAHADGDDIVLDDTGTRVHVCENVDGRSVTGEIADEVTLFALTSGLGLGKLTAEYRAQLDDYKAMMAKFVCDRLVEAFADTVLPGGCRVAVGYPALPDHKFKRVIFDMLDVERLTGMSLTETCMIVPGESICGFYIFHV